MHTIMTSLPEAEFGPIRHLGQISDAAPSLPPIFGAGGGTALA
jgi:hypothetical protein